MLEDLEVELTKLEDQLGIDTQPANDQERLSIMVVDDDLDYLDAVVSALSHELNVVKCASGEEALAKLSDKICAVILDIKMPGMDGLEVLREIYKRRPDMPVVLNTGYTGEYLEDDIKRQYKPFGYVNKDSPTVLQINLATAIKFFRTEGKTDTTQNVVDKAGSGRSSRRSAERVQPPKPPFQLDWIEPRLIDANGRPFFMSDRLHSVLRVMLSKEPGGRAPIRGGISDKTVAVLYAGRDIDDPEEAKRISMNFRANLRKTFAKYGLIDRNSLIKRSKTLGGYVMGKDWHPKRPLVNSSEVRLVFRDDIECAASSSEID